jgi:hypothetical protein
MSIPFFQKKGNRCFIFPEIRVGQSGQAEPTGMVDFQNFLWRPTGEAIYAPAAKRNAMQIGCAF